MYSFVSICGSPENGQIRCELELVPATESEYIEPEDKDTTMLDLSERLFTDYFDAIGREPSIEEGDIFVAVLLLHHQQVKVLKRGAQLLEELL